MPYCKKGCTDPNTRKPTWHRTLKECPFQREQRPAPPPTPGPERQIPQPTEPGGVTPDSPPGPSPTPPASATPTSPGAAAAPKQGKFQWPFRRVPTRYTEENPPNAPRRPPEDMSWELNPAVVGRAIKTLVKAIREGFRFLSTSLNAPPPNDEIFELRPAEQDEMADLAVEPATAFMKGMGFKSKARAEAFLNGIYVLFFFGRMLMGLAGWGVDTARLVGERRARGETASGRKLTPEEIQARSEGRAAPTSGRRWGLFGRRGGALPTPGKVLSETPAPPAAGATA
jgi:hypothetical protein